MTNTGKQLKSIMIASALWLIAGALLTPSTKAFAANSTLKSPQPVSKAKSLAVVDNMVAFTDDSLTTQADYYWHHGDYPRIIAMDRLRVEIDPTDTDAYSIGGWLMESGGDLKDAEIFYKRGIVNNPQNSYMAYQLGFFYLNTTHDYKKCIALMSKTINDPDAGVLDYKLLAHAYTDAKEYKNALATWQTIETKYPNAPAVAHNLQEAQADVAKYGSVSN